MTLRGLAESSLTTTTFVEHTNFILEDNGDTAQVSNTPHTHTLVGARVGDVTLGAPVRRGVEVAFG
jgi:hypothetical protein